MKHLLLLLLLALPLKAGDPWTKTEIALETTYQTLLFIDWKQTSEFHRSKIIRADGSTYEVHERNMFLGSEPKQSTINLMCLLSAFGHFALSNAQGHKDRILWQSATVGIELFAVGTNINAKIRIRW